VIFHQPKVVKWSRPAVRNHALLNLYGEDILARAYVTMTRCAVR
jgi:hypothetical protein